MQVQHRVVPQIALPLSQPAHALSPKRRALPPVPPTLAHKRPRTSAQAAPADCFVPPPRREVRLRTPLHKAIDAGQFAEACRLLSEGASVTARDSDGQTPLHYAAARDNIHLLEKLLEAGADPFTLDHQGDTPMHSAAAAVRSATSLLLARLLAGREDDMARWPDPIDVERRLTRVTVPRGAAYAPIDDLVRQLSGTRRDLNKHGDVLKYVGHLMSLDGEIGGIGAEGWHRVPFLLQRLRSEVSMFLRPRHLPEALSQHFTRREVRALLLAEIVGTLASLNCVRHLYNAGGLNPAATEALSRVEAQHVLARVLDLSPCAEFTVPLGLPTHAIYGSMRRASAEGVEVIVFRLDNLGWGHSRGHGQAKGGKVSPCRFNIPREFLLEESGRNRVCDMLVSLMGYMHDDDVDIDMIYAQLTLLVRDLHKKFPSGIINASIDQSSGYWKSAQTVGNCSLKNHSAGVFARLAMASRLKLGKDADEQNVQALAYVLWHWFKQQEIDLVLDRLWHFVITPNSLRHRYHEKKGRQLKDLLNDADARQNGRLISFLTKPRRDNVARDIRGEDLAELVRAAAVQEMTLLLERGVDLTDERQRCFDKTTLLHEAVRSDSTRATTMVRLLLDHGAKADERDGDDRTAYELAARRGRTAVVRELIACGGVAGSADVAALLRKQLATTQKALRELQALQDANAT